MPKLVVGRHHEWGGLLRRMKVTAGDEHLVVRAGSQEEVELPAGTHEVRASMDWCQSPVLHVTLADDDEVHLQTRLPGNPFAMFTRPSSCVRLTVDEQATRRAGTSADVAAAVRVEQRSGWPRGAGRTVVLLVLVLLVLGPAMWWLGSTVGTAAGG